jgi:imidazolonepropionase-like amidohydrolase
MGIGTDTAAMAIERVPANYVRELELSVEGAYTVPAALMAAAKTSAEILDMAHQLGTLEAGKRADVIVVNGAPDIRRQDLPKIDKVIRNGYVVVDHGQVTIPRPVPDPLPTRKQGAHTE